MLPLYPPYAINDLAHQPLEGRLPNGRPRQRHHDPDGFFEDAATLQPDPVFMGLRRLLSSGPIGGLMRWMERKAEERDDRTSGSRIDDVASPITLGEPEPRHDDGDDRLERKTAA